MKLKLTRRKRLLSARREIPTSPGFVRTHAPLAQKKERLYAAIERTQAFMHKRVPAQDAMNGIRRRYPAPMYFVESSRRALEHSGIPRLDAFYYAMMPALTRTCLSQQWGMHPRLGGLSLMREYLKTLYVGRHVECFYLILLDRQGRLIRPALLQRGGVDNAPFYLGQLLEVTLNEEARYIVLAHNHPRGTPSPSKEDLNCTLKALSAFAPLGIPLLDHLIVAGNKVVSIRGTGLLSPVLWTVAATGSRLVKNWLDA